MEKESAEKSDQVGFNAQNIISDKEGTLLIIKCSSYQKEVYT